MSQNLNPENWRKLEDLYNAAIAVSGEERKALLARADPDLRAHVERMLSQGETYLDHPAWENRVSLAGESEAETIPALQLGPYRIEEQIGRGGMGQVFRARDTRLDRDVAIKISRQSFSERFEREARAIAHLNHPRICTLHDIGPNYLVMEFLDGETLASRLKRGALSKAEIFGVGSQIANALAAAHASGIVHRDLKPANIMLTTHGVKVLDFGLAKFAGLAKSADTADDLTRTGLAMGTPLYMSPEQIDGGADQRTDLFSLGLVLHEMATSKLPTPGTSLGHQLKSGGATPGIQTGSPLLNRLISELLAFDPAQRPGAAAVEERLRGIGVARCNRIFRPAVAAFVMTLAGITWWAYYRGVKPVARHPEVTKEIGPAAGEKTDPTFSPDGSKIAFFWSGEKDERGIYVIPSSGGEPVRLTRSPNTDISPAWSPDGKTIAFLRRHPGAADELMLAPSSGGPERKVRDIRNPELVVRNMRPLLAWTPGGKAIVLTMDDSMTFGAKLFRVPLDGSQATRVTSVADRSWEGRPAFSPDGRTLAYTSSCGLCFLTLPPDGRPAAPARTFATGANFQSLTWSPEGNELLFVRAAPSTASAGARIAAFDLARSEVQELYVTPVLTQAMTARWDHPREPRVVFSRESSQQQTFALALRDGKAAGDPVRLPLPNPYMPALSPDGRWMAFASLADGTGISSLWIADSHGGRTRKIAYGFDESRWSPDGRHIAFHGGYDRGGPAQVFIFDLDPTAEILKAPSVPPAPSRKVSDTPYNLFGPDWSPDARFIYATRPGVPYHIVRFPAAGGEVEDLFEGDYPRIARGGSRIFYGKDGLSGLFSRSLDGDVRSNPEERIVPDYVSPRGFDLNSRGIYYIGRDAARRMVAIRHYDFETKRVTDVAPPPRGRAPAIALSGDGSLLLYDTVADVDGSLTSIQFKRIGN
jgi:Tol biopolymer transport system component/tRNA A-37 threonylcarbamoyl transferase component Bud32